MESFNPDKYLSKVPAASGFDPDSYLKNAPSVKTESGAKKPNWAKDHPGLYEAAISTRQAVGPTLEALGAIGGGLAGAAVGTVASPTVVVNPVTGGVAGSALGYSAVKEVLNKADEILGLRAPRTNNQLITEPINNLAEGALYEMGGQVGGKVLQKGLEVAGRGLGRGAEVITGLPELPTQKAAEIARQAAGEQLPEIQAALRTAPRDITAAQAIVRQIDPVAGRAVVTAPETLSMLRFAQESNPAYFSNVMRGQDTTRRNMLSELAGASNQTGARSNVEGAKKSLNALTTPMRDVELAAANTAGKKLTDLEARAFQKQESMVSALQDQGRAGTTAAQTTAERAPEFSEAAEIMSSVKGQRQLEKGFIDRQIQSLDDHGLRPLKADPIINRINSVLKDPKFAANDPMHNAVKNVGDEIAQWTKNGGIIDADALYAIRKNAVNSAIQKSLGAAKSSVQKEAAAKVLAEINPIIDNAIEAAGGSGWKSYLKTHAAGMEELSKTKLGAEAMRLYQSSPKKFIDLVEGNSPKVVEKIFGPGKYDLVKTMGQEAAERLSSAGKELRQNQAIIDQATEGQKAFDSLLKDHFFKFQLPNSLNIAATTVNKVLDVMTGKIGEKTMKVLTDSAKTAKSFEELLNTVPPSDKVKILKMLKDPKTIEALGGQVGKVIPKNIRGGVALGINSSVNNLGDSSENRNALVSD